MESSSQARTISGSTGLPETPDELLTHQALMRGTETWQFMDGDKTISIHPQGRFKADSGTALAAAAVAGLGIAWLPDHRHPCPDGRHVRRPASWSALHT